MVLHAENCMEQITKVCQDSSSDMQEQNLSKVPRAAAPPPPKGIPDLMRRRVSKGRNRFVEEGFDLDLTYITERIIAMSFPGSGLETVYRNSLMDVAKMLKTKHKDNYMIFNLSERSYDVSRFNNQVLDFGWPDHLAPSLERLSIVCKSMKSWLDSDDQHVVVVHCKGGKGRTGCVIASFMNYSQICPSAKAALDHFAMKRFYDSKLQGVTQPSQRRYVHYFSDLLSGKINLNAPPVILRYVIIHGVPNFDGKGGCRPFLKVYQNMELMHTSGLYVCPADKDRIKISLYGGLKLEGEILIKCFHKRTHTGLDSIFQCQFHHAVIRDLRMVLGKDELNDAFRDKRFPDSVKVELIFDPWSKKESSSLAPSSAGESTNIRHSLLAERLRDIPGCTSPAPEDKRNSYDGFEGGYDHGRPGEDLIKFDDENDDRERSESIKLDPALIERVATENGELYTVVSKDSSQSNSKESSPSHHRHTVMGVPVRNSPPQPPPSHFRMSAVNGMDQQVGSPARPGSRESELVQSSGSHKYSHLFHQTQKSSKQPPAKPVRPPIDSFYSEIEEVREEVKKLDEVQNHNSSRSPNRQRKYDLINNEGKKLVLTQAPHRGSVDDSEIWMTVKWQTLPQDKQEGTGSVKRSSSQGDLGDFAASEDYTNLTDIAVGTPFVTETQRMHSLAEGDDTIAIKPSESKPSSKIVMNPSSIDDEIYTVPPDVHDQDEVYSVPPEEDGIDYDEVADPEYINYDGELLGKDHDYQNQQLLHEQMALSEFIPSSSEPTRPAVVQQKAVKESSGLRGIFGFKKPTKTIIQSSAISERERKEALPPLQFGNSSKLLVGRGDYMQFGKDAWGGRQQLQQRQQQQQRKDAHPQAAPNHHQPPSHPGKPEAKDRIPSQQPLQNRSPKSKRKPHKPPSPEGRELPPLPSHHSAHALQQPKAHIKLQAVKSQPMVDRSSAEQHREIKPHRSSGKFPQQMVPPHSQPKGVAVVGPAASRSRPNPPPKPLPYRPEVIKPSPPVPSAPATPLSVSQVKAMMTDWYRPNITRDAAITMVKRMEPGCFVVRDSQTVSGGYALTIKVAEELVRQRRKLGNSVEVTDDMCVTHFLIQPDPDGVKLQGWNEPAFKTLPDFIAKHTSDRLCLPCVLRLVKGSPDSHGNWRRQESMQQSLVTGAACDLVFLGNLEVSGSSGDVVIGDAAQQLKALDLPTITIVNFKASNNGITITDSTSGLLNKRNYPIHSITYCGFDPQDTRWDFPSLYHLGDSISLRNKQCFGIIHKMLDGNGHICLLFAELDEDQPVSNVVSYVRHLLSQHPSHHHVPHPHRRH